MNSIRVHSSAPGNPGCPRYLLLTEAGPGRISLDFTFLAADQGLSSLTLSEDALYDILTGKDLVISLPEASFVFCARGEELVVAVRTDTHTASSEFRVWLAEVALGWNILSRNANTWI